MCDRLVEAAAAQDADFGALVMLLNTAGTRMDRIPCVTVAGS